MLVALCTFERQWNCAYFSHHTSFSEFESLAVSGAGTGPQRSVEGWVIFVTGIDEEAQVHALAVATDAV